MTSYEEYEPEGPRGWNPLAVALIATLVLLLGLGGALFGINVANKNKQAAAQGQVLPQTLQTPPVYTPSPTPTITATPTPTAPPTVPPVTTPPPTGDTFALPNLNGLDFRTARTRVRDLKLGWRLVFEGTSTDASVRTTDPAPNAQVKVGATVKILVVGAAPIATVPPVKGLPCAQAAGLVVDQGLYPEYPTGREGVVLDQTPSASAPRTLHWNDMVQLTCGTA